MKVLVSKIKLCVRRIQSFDYFNIVGQIHSLHSYHHGTHHSQAIRTRGREYLRCDILPNNIDSWSSICLGWTVYYHLKTLKFNIFYST